MKQHQLVSSLSAIALVSGLWVGEGVQAITFSPPPNGGTPSQTTGGASRGTINFQPPAGRGTPTQATGGASRGTVFAPPAGNSSPRQGSVGGASRNGVFTPVSGSGSPQRTSSGASRQGDYSFNSSSDGTPTRAAIVALLPQTYSGLTVSERPTFLAYLPASTATEMVFHLKDEAGNSHYKTILPTSGKAGVVAVKLPDQAPALALGKNYQWFLALKVDGKLTPSTPYVDGWIQRITPDADLARKLADPDALRRTEALAARGVWYDCVATLASLYATQPGNPALANSWSELLMSVGLQDIKTAPLVAFAR